MDTKGIILSIILSTTTGILAAVILKRLLERFKKELQFCLGDLANPSALVINCGTGHQHTAAARSQIRHSVANALFPTSG